MILGPQVGCWVSRIDELVYSDAFGAGLTDFRSKRSIKLLSALLEGRTIGGAGGRVCKCVEWGQELENDEKVSYFECFHGSVIYSMMSRG